MVKRPIRQSHREAFVSYRERGCVGHLGAWPEGESEGESFVDHDGIDLTRRFAFMSGQKDRRENPLRFQRQQRSNPGPANIRPPLVRAACAYCLVALVDRFLPINHGLARVIETTFRPGSVVDPHFPAAVNTYMPTALRRPPKRYCARSRPSSPKTDRRRLGQRRARPRRARLAKQSRLCSLRDF